MIVNLAVLLEPSGPKLLAKSSERPVEDSHLAVILAELSRVLATPKKTDKQRLNETIHALVRLEARITRLETKA